MLMLERQKQILMSQRNSIYTQTFTPREVQDQSSYAVTPNSVGTQTEKAGPGLRTIDHATYTIISAPPKKANF